VNAPRPTCRDEADQLADRHRRGPRSHRGRDVRGRPYTRGSPSCAAAPLTGVTESRWRALGPEIDLLWAHFAVLGQSLEEARAIRARHRPGDQGWAATRPVAARAQRGTRRGWNARDHHPSRYRGQPGSRSATWPGRSSDVAPPWPDICPKVDAAFSAVAGRLAHGHRGRGLGAGPRHRTGRTRGRAGSADIPGTRPAHRSR